MKNKIFVEGVPTLNEGALCVAETAQGRIYFKGIINHPFESVIFTIIDGVVTDVNYCENDLTDRLPLPDEVYGRRLSSFKIGERNFFYFEDTDRWVSPSEKSEIDGLLYPSIELFLHHYDDEEQNCCWVIESGFTHAYSKILHCITRPFEIEGLTIDLQKGTINGTVSPDSKFFENHNGKVVFKKNLIPTCEE